MADITQVATQDLNNLSISWFSNAPWAATGYGNQTKIFVPRIMKLGHNVTITAFYGLEGGVITWNGTRIFPRAKNSYGLDIIGAAAMASQANIIITLLDAWIFSPPALPLPWFPWYPVDHEPMPVDVINKVRQARKGIVYSKFAQEQAQLAGLDVYYVPHGVETGKFYPADRAKARKILGLPEDAFVVGMVAANKGVPPRKSFFEQIAAFAALRKQHHDAVLYLHTEDGTKNHPELVNLVEYARLVGLMPGKNVFFPEQYTMTLGFSDDYMRDMYNSMDVLMNVAKGEGFGIPLVEAQACGVPVITGDWTAQGELCFSGWKIPKTEAIQTYDPHFHAFWWTVKTEAVYERLCAAYELRGNQEYRDRAKKGAQAYDADKVTEKYWQPVLQDILYRINYDRKTSTVKNEQA